jgi:cytochrome c biogenesis protein CcmG, thiol:disulfide interchange protein DsbE
MKRLAIVITIIAILGALFTFGLFRTDKNRDIPSATLDKPVKDFELPVYERFQLDYGPSFKLSDYVGQKPMIINFWATWCPPCREEMPLLEQAWQQYQDQILFIGVQTQDRGKKQEGNALIDEMNLTFPMLIDDDSKVSINYALFGVPETFFVRKDGTLLYKYTGGVTPALLEEKIGELLK